MFCLLPIKTIGEAINQAKPARTHILEKMNAVIDTPRSEVTDRAPKVATIMIKPEKVGLLIGPGGKQIKKIEEDTKAVVYVVDGDKGEVSISGKNSDIINLAKKVIQELVKDVEKGEVYDGKVVKIMNFGAFAEVAPGKQGLIHISEISKERVEDVESVLSVGEEVKVKVIKIDRQGRIDLSIKALLSDDQNDKTPKKEKKEKEDDSDNQEEFKSSRKGNRKQLGGNS